MSESNKRNFIVHGSILAIAGILVRIIGMLYRIPVVNIIGSEGNAPYIPLPSLPIILTTGIL